jgi:hypothetical protein
MTALNILRQDAAKMMRILTTANCVARYSTISLDRLSEILTAIVMDGTLVGGNSKGHDIVSPTFGRVEVKSRILGTDGPFPRVSLKTANMERADFFVAVRWTEAMQFYDAVGLPKAAAATLYAAKRQGNGLAHIVWGDWIAAPSARNLRAEMLQALGQVSKPPWESCEATAPLDGAQTV